MKEISVTDKELAGLMDDLESMLATETGTVSETPHVVAEFTTGLGTDKPAPVSMPSSYSPEVLNAACNYEKLKGTVIGDPGPFPVAATTGFLIDAENITAGTLKPSAPTNELRHFVDPEAFRKEIVVSELHLDEAMIEQSSLRAYYGTQAAYAAAQADRMKNKFEVLEARLYDEHKRALAKSGEKTTDKAIEAAVKLDSRWIEGKNLVVDAETIAGVNKNLTFALSDRRDMLIQLGSDRRAERQGEVRINAKQAEEASLRERARKISVSPF